MPKWQRWIGWALLASALAAVGLIATGLFDPHSVGHETWSQPLATQHVPATSRRVSWLRQAPDQSDYSVQMTVAYEAGELDASYGILLGSDENYLAVAVSPTGYVAIFTGEESSLPERERAPSFILPWQVWPHVRPGSGLNELWLDVTDDSTGGHQLRVRINRELLWAGPIDDLGRGIGYYGESFGGPVQIDFVEFLLFDET